MPDSSLHAVAWPFVAGPADSPQQAIGLTWKDAEILPPDSLMADGQTLPLQWTSAPGRFPQGTILVPLGQEERTVRLSVGGQETECRVTPPRSWELFLAPHSHVDIGYTEFQDVLADAHGDYVAQALDLMTETDPRPDEQQYRWTCEASWTVEQFLRRHPGREEEFARRVREGRMELTALYVNLTDLFDAGMLEKAVETAATFRDKHGLPMVSACNYDVNGFGWALPSILQRQGVKYLDTAINEVRALGVRPRPRPYRWASPDGSEVLLWHSLGYLAGNDHQLHSSVEKAEPHVAGLLNRLAAEGYPHTGMEMLISGTTGDSMPPDGEVCEVVAQWNRKWLSPKLRLATVGNWFAHLEASWPGEITRYQKAWPDWWADGNGSALAEAALVRRTQARLADLEVQRRVIEQSGTPLKNLQPQYDHAWRRAMLFAEHTWGPYESAHAPDSDMARGQWHSKAANAYAAAALADSIALEQMVALATDGKVSARSAGMTNATLQGEPSGYLASPDPSAVLLFNPLQETRTEVVSVHVPWHLVPGLSPGQKEAEPQIIDSITGKAVPTQVHRYPPEDVVNVNHYRVEFLAADQPPSGHRAYRIASAPICPSLTEPVETWTLENAYFSLAADPLTGALTSLLHKESGRELVQAGTPYGLGQCIYETVDDPAGRNRIASWYGRGSGEMPFRHTTPQPSASALADTGLSFSRLTLTADGPNGMRLETQFTLPDHDARVDLSFRLTKTPTDEAEAVYHAFPLLSDRAEIWLSAAGGALRPGLDQVPGTATDWHGIQTWFAVADPGGSVVVASPDVPLVQVNGISTGRWQETLPPPNGLVMSWAMNNYWFTNFPVRQGGRVSYRYSLQFQGGKFDPKQAERFAAGVRHPSWGQALRLSEEQAARLR